jgi:hypothetical protein
MIAPKCVDTRVVLTRMKSKLWFSPKKYLGWGWRTESREVRLSAAVIVLLMVMSPCFWGHSRLGPIALLLFVYGVAVLLTGDPPGGLARLRDPEPDDTTSWALPSSPARLQIRRAPQRH